VADRRGVPNDVRFPRKKNAVGKAVCRICEGALPERRRMFCNERCRRDFFMATDWGRIRRVVFERDGATCMKCSARLSGNAFHVDHIVPLAQGGAEWDLDNLELSCERCNLSKGAKTEVMTPRPRLPRHRSLPRPKTG
jgi:5-methylcytosine-specific restriction endonuclease McrA